MTLNDRIHALQQPTRRVWLFVLAALLLALGSGCDKLDALKDAVDKSKDKGSDKAKASVILTGGEKGNYYKAAKELNEVLGDELALEIKASSGSFGNLEELGQGKADYAIVQFDTLIMFLRMGEQNKQWANNSLAIAPLSNELVHILVSKKANIRSLADLKNKRIGAGPARSGTFVSAFTIMVYFNDVNLEKYRNTFNDSYEDSLEKLQKGELDAMFITSAAGMPLLKELPADKATNIAMLDVGTNVKLPKGIEYTYAVEPLPKGTYPWQDKDVNMLATPSYLFARHNLSSSVTRKIAKAIYEGADDLKKKSGLWKLVSKERAQQDMKFGIGFHAGVKAYFASGK